MDSHEFIVLIRRFVYESAVSDVSKTLKKPPGRSWGYPRTVADRTAWVNSLDEEGQRHLHSAIRNAAHAAVFGFLCVLDGVRQIENEPSRGTLELFHKSSRDETLLNAPTGDMLHDIFNENLDI